MTEFTRMSGVAASARRCGSILSRETIAVENLQKHLCQEYPNAAVEYVDTFKPHTLKGEDGSFSLRDHIPNMLTAVFPRWGKLALYITHVHA